MSVPEVTRALRLHRPRSGQDGPDVRWDAIATPQPTAGEVLVRVDACALDPDDLALVGGDVPSPALPLTLGRAGAGTVAATGPGAGDWQPGDPVALDGSVTCGRCGYCATGRDNLCVARSAMGRDRDGAHAQFVIADARHLLPAPGGVPAAVVAVVVRSLAVPYHALKRAGVGEGVALAVHGLGGQGLHAVLLAKLAGAHVIGVDRDAGRRETALDWGADETIDAQPGDVARRVRELTDGGADCSLELTGRPEGAQAAADGLRPGGRATFTRRGAWSLPSATLTRSVDEELDLVGSHDPTLQDVGELLDLLADDRLDLSRSVAHQVPTEQLSSLLTSVDPEERDPDIVVATAH